MLITLCYSVLTWIQSRHRKEIHQWLQEYPLKGDFSIVVATRSLTRAEDEGSLTRFAKPTIITENPQQALPSAMTFIQDGFGSATSTLNSREGFSFLASTSSAYPGTSVTSRSSSISSVVSSTTPKRSQDALSRDSTLESLLEGLQKPGTEQVSPLCYNSKLISWKKLLLEEDRVRILALAPKQIVELHEWTTFIGSETFLTVDEDCENALEKMYVLLEAVPGVIQRDQYRNFLKFGRLAAWKCGEELALILHSSSAQVIDLMHIFRLGQVILAGGWRVHRLSTVKCEGHVGTLVRRPDTDGNCILQLTPADLHRLSAVVGLCEGPNKANLPHQPSVTKSTSKSDFAAISEESSLEEGEDDTLNKLPNWHERSPKKKSVHSSPYEKPGTRKRTGSCSGNLSGTGNKSLSLASLLMCSKSQSVDEESGPGIGGTANPLSPQSVVFSGRGAFLNSRQASVNSGGPAQSFDNLLGSPKSLVYGSSSPKVLSPVADSLNPAPGLDGKPFKSYSAFSSPKKVPTNLSTRPHGGSVANMGRNTPSRMGKPPNILVLCEDKTRRAEIVKVLKSLLAGDRYIIYDIRWDQLAVGGWADQTALLVLSGRIPDESHIPLLLQFLGDGGRMLSWCCDNPPFGIAPGANSAKTGDEKQLGRKSELLYLSTQTRSLPLSDSLWGSVGDVKELPAGFQRVIGTQDSDGYSRPLTASVFARTKGTNEACILLLDGGALGGKAVLSRVQFEKSSDDTAITLLSQLLSQVLGIDFATTAKLPEYSCGYLIGDHMKVQNFINALPPAFQQTHLKIEIVPRGSKQFSTPSAEVLPIKVMECPPNFSTLDYFNTLTTRELGRIVISVPVISSTMHVFEGRPLQHGTVVIAERQTCGRGRGGNVWLSPLGCVSFSVLVKLDLNTQMARRISLIQHLSVIAMVLSVDKHKDINMKVKWPNDIYIDNQKIGGVLVQSQIESSTAYLNIGIGVNLSNEYPTMSINAALPSSDHLNVPKLVAKCLSNLEFLMDKVEGGGIADVLSIYTDNWIHSTNDVDGNENIVRVEVNSGSYAECRITNIDEFGFLRVTDIHSGNVFSVQPDGNSFDIVNKLIAIKG